MLEHLKQREGGNMHLLSGVNNGSIHLGGSSPPSTHALKQSLQPFHNTMQCQIWEFLDIEGALFL